MSVTDEISSQLQNKAEEKVSQAIQAVPNAVRGIGSGINGAVSGIVFVFKAPYLSAKGVMAVVGKMQHNPKYSKQNISIKELGENSDIKKVDEALTMDVMKHFDKSCKKCGITYSALVDKSNPKDPTYYVFFKGKETPAIEHALKEAYQSYVKEQAKPKVSVRAKLAFFRKRVTDRDKGQQELGQEKHNSRPEMQR